MEKRLEECEKRVRGREGEDRERRRKREEGWREE